MKSTFIVIGMLVVAFAAGLLLGPRLGWDPEQGATAPGAAPEERKILYWVAPMDPNFKRDEPGKSPMGMDLVPVYADDVGGETVTISPQVENNLGVRTAPATVRPLWRRIEATGYVGFDETRISHINTRVKGWIVDLHADAEGEEVVKGDPLFEFYSPELVNAQKEYLSALRRGRGPMLDGAQEKLRALGMVPAQIEALAREGVASENVRINSPQDGILTSLSVREGMYIQPNTPIMTLADLSSVWLQAEVFASQADWVAEGQSATATIESMAGTEFQGQVEYVYPVLDPQTRTLRVRLQFDNPGQRLKPNMYARVTIYGRLKPNALTVPRSAVIPAPGNDRVVVSLGEGDFEVREVMTGLESGEYVDVLAGLSEGERVVTSAQFLIDSEASISGSIRRLDASQDWAEQRSLDRVYVSGWVDAVDRENQRVRISHGPIDDLGWPAMTMVFDTIPGLDLADIRAGQDVRFGLLQRESGEYVLEHIHPGASADGQMETVRPEDMAEGGGGEHASHQEAAPVETVGAMAVVRGVSPDERIVTLEHAPIAELDWPAMTMKFDVGPEVVLDTLEVGQEIHFVMSKPEEGGWVIEQVHVMPESAGEHDHD